jgi:hypothetical protein
MNLLEHSARKKLYISITAILILTLSISTLSISRQTYAAPAVHSGVVIPLYVYPDSTWTTIATTAKANPNVPIIAVINPNSGPGLSYDPTYLASVQNLQSSGVTILGYVATGYATSSYSSTSNMESQILQYKTWYHVNGIFFDEMSNTPGYESYYSTLNGYVKSNGMTYTMGNPGTSVPASYIGILDNLCIYESSGYPSLSFITYAGYPESNFGLIAYGVSYSGSFVTSAAPFVGYMYIDDLTGGNPYSALSSLFSQTVATLAIIDSQTSSSTTSATSTTSASTTTTTTTSSSTTKSTSTVVPTPVTIKVVSVNSLGGQFTGMYAIIKSASGKVLAHGYTTMNFKGLSGTTYTVCVSNYQATIFSHWSNGRTNSCQTVRPTSNLVMTAYYG